MAEALMIVNAFLDLTNNRKDITAAAQLLTTDVVFVGPLMRTSGASDYAALLEKFLPAHVETRILKQFENADDACSVNDLVVRAPSGGTITLSMVKWFRLRGGKIAEHRVYIDAYDISKAWTTHPSSARMARRIPNVVAHRAGNETCQRTRPLGRAH